jgi:hypothetical protein
MARPLMQAEGRDRLRLGRGECMLPSQVATHVTPPRHSTNRCPGARTDNTCTRYSVLQPSDPFLAGYKRAKPVAFDDAGGPSVGNILTLRSKAGSPDFGRAGPRGQIDDLSLSAPWLTGDREPPLLNC